MLSRGFTLPKHRSPSFGSYATCSRSVKLLFEQNCLWLLDTNLALSPLIETREALQAETPTWIHSLSLRVYAFNERKHLQVTYTPWSVFQDGTKRTLNLLTMTSIIRKNRIFVTTATQSQSPTHKSEKAKDDQVPDATVKNWSQSY